MMTGYANVLRTTLLNRLGKANVVFLAGWGTTRDGAWKSAGARPAGIMLHHTAAAATASMDPTANGNARGANNGVINYIHTNARVPWANFTIDRDGTLYVHSAFPVWHAGGGTFKGKAPWSYLGIPANGANRHMLGVEIMSKGASKDFTRAQKDTLGMLIVACAGTVPGWEPIDLARRPQHRDWTARKVDLRYTNAEVLTWVKAAMVKTATAVKKTPVKKAPAKR